MLDAPKPTPEDFGAAEAWANTLPDAAPGVIHEPAMHLNPPTAELGDFDDSEFIESIKKHNNITNFQKEDEV